MVLYCLVWLISWGFGLLVFCLYYVFNLFDVVCFVGLLCVLIVAFLIYLLMLMTISELLVYLLFGLLLGVLVCCWICFCW